MYDSLPFPIENTVPGSKVDFRKININDAENVIKLKSKNRSNISFFIELDKIFTIIENGKRPGKYYYQKYSIREISAMYYAPI